MLERRHMVLALCLVLSGSPLPAFAALSVTIDGGTVLASGVTPGASVAWIGLSRPDLEFETVYEAHRAQVVDSDSDGLVTLSPAAGVPWKSVFVAVDLANLAYAVVAPEGFEFPLTFLPVGFAPSEVSGPMDEMLLNLHRAEVLVARAGSGAFSEGGWDGGDTDGDTVANDTLMFSAGELDSLATAPTALTTFEAGDLVVVIDSEQMGVNVYTLPAEAP